MAKTRSRGRSGARSSKAMRPKADWVETFESWDNSPGIGDTQINLAANEEFWIPLVNTYTAWGINSEDATAPAGTYTRGLPWPKRKVLRVRGWVHTSSPNYFTGNAEMLATLQLERARTDAIDGTVIIPGDIATTFDQMDVTTYGKWQHYLAHHSSWLSPDDFTTFKKSFFIDKKVGIVLDELETLALRITWRCFEATPRLFVRPFLRTLVTNQ